MPTAEQIVSRYLFNEDTPPANLKDEALIRAAGAKGDPIEVDMDEFMTTGGGRFADVARFNFVRNFLAGNDYTQGEPSGGATLAPGVYSTKQLLGLYGLNPDLHLGIGQYYCGLYDADYVDRCYVFGSSAFKINEDAWFTVHANGAREIDNICVEPVNDNFDYESDSPPAIINNTLTEHVIDPYQLGRQVPIEFTGSVTARQHLTSADLPSLTARNLTAVTTETSYKAFVAAATDASHFAGLFQSFLGNLRNKGIVDYQDGHGRFILHDGQDVNHDGIVDAQSCLPEPLWGSGAAILGGGGHDHLLGFVGPDELYGGAGNDADALYGGQGDDQLYAIEDDSTQDALHGGEGNTPCTRSSSSAPTASRRPVSSVPSSTPSTRPTIPVSSR
jgi:hypothetical protein